MKTVRLTNAIRSEIISKAMSDIFEQKTDDLIKRSNRFARDLYYAMYGPELTKLRSLNLQHHWLSGHSSRATLYSTDEKGNKRQRRLHQPDSTRYVPAEKITGYVEKRLMGEGFGLGETLPFPGYRDSLVALKGKWEDILNGLMDDALVLINEEKKLTAELDAFLKACKNSNDLISNWPEGSKYLPKPEQPKKLPIPLIDNVRRAMP